MKKTLLDLKKEIIKPIDYEKLLRISSNTIYIKYTMLHQNTIMQLKDEANLPDIYPCHDMDKLIYYLFLNKMTVHRLHISTTYHHDMSIFNNIVAIERCLDYESAHLTKPDKPLSAHETIKKYNENHLANMEPILKLLDYWEKGNYTPITQEQFNDMCKSISTQDMCDRLEFARLYLKNNIDKLINGQKI